MAANDRYAHAVRMTLEVVAVLEKLAAAAREHGVDGERATTSSAGGHHG